MSSGQVWVRVAILVVAAMAGVATDVKADEADRHKTSVSSVTKSVAIPRVRDLKQPAITVKDWVAQMEAAQVQVTNVKLEPTETGLDITLETADGKPLQVDATKFRREGNSLIADIPNAVLALPQGQTFVADNPTADIATVQVTQQGGNIRVSVAGNNALPKTEVTLKTGGLAYSFNPEGDEADDEIVVTGAGRGAYRVPNTSTATRTDTPIRDIPQSIQVIPRQVLEDRKPRTLNQAIETVSGVVSGGTDYGLGGRRIIRGFELGDSGGTANLRNGFRDIDGYGLISPATIEQIEIIKGPASVLFGAFEPGGIVNVITRQPLREPSYNLSLEAGNYGLIQPSFDFTGPLNGKRNILYRLIASYQAANSIQDFVNTNQITIAPSVTLNLGEQTSLNLYYEYTKVVEDPAQQRATLLSNGNFTSRGLLVGYPKFLEFDMTTQRYGYVLTHQFNDSWQIRNNFSVTATNVRKQEDLIVTSVLDDRFLGFEYYVGPYTKDNYSAQIDLLGKFNTGSIAHQLLIGFDFNRFVDIAGKVFFSTDFPSLDIRSPNYFVVRPDLELIFEGSHITRQAYGIYLQDQIAFSNNLKLLIGGRYDWISYRNDIFGDGIAATSQDNGAFSPRLGIVYQPSDAISLYMSYSQSFRQAVGFNSDERAFEPTRGTQYEVGVKTDFLNGRLSANLAAYHLTKTNIITPDPTRPRFSIQSGEQRSQGIELDVAGEILPGWKVVASYAYTDAEVTKDNRIPVGNRLRNTPTNQASLWTTYEIQKGALRGLGFGLGLFYVGERPGNLANSFTLNSYLRTDAAVYYRRDRLEAAINVRNLFDVDYGESAYSRTTIYRGSPFTITGSVRWNF